MWTYNETDNYYYCFLHGVRLLLQPKETCYTVWVYGGKMQALDVKTHIYVTTLEEAKRMALEIALNLSKERAALWGSIVASTESAIRSL